MVQGLICRGKSATWLTLAFLVVGACRSASDVASSNPDPALEEPAVAESLPLPATVTLKFGDGQEADAPLTGFMFTPSPWVAGAI